MSPQITWGVNWLAVDKKREPLPNWKVLWDDRRNTSTIFSRQLLQTHLLAQPKYKPKHLPQSSGGGSVDACFGSYGISLNFNGHVSPVCYDADNEDLIDLWETCMRPQLEAANIEYIEEYRGLDNERRHYWFFLEPIEIMWSNALQAQFRLNSHKSKEQWFPEIYPYGPRENSLISLPWGLYLKRMKVMWGEYCGNPITSLEEAMQAVIDCKPISEEKLKSLLKNQTPKEKKQYTAPPRVILNPTNDLSIPGGIPEYLSCVGKKCQAINQVLWKTEDVNAVVDHDVGLGLAAMATYHDNQTKTTEGKEWIESLHGGINSPEQQLLYYYPKRDYTPTCKSLDSLLGACDGCPFRKQIKNPKQLYKAETIQREKIGEVHPISLEEIRETIFPQVNKLIDNALASGKQTDILLEAIKGAGKSVLADQIAVRLSNEGYYTCIACNSTKVALEHKARIEEMGGKAFIMASFDAIFEYFSGGITCPEYSNIKDLQSLGVDSSYWKKKYCKECPFYEECNYPKQYSQVQDDKHQIVIIQHAHLAVTEVVRQLWQKQFACLIVDETFIGQITTQLIPTQSEMDLLGELVVPNSWLSNLLSWMEGGHYPGPKIKPIRSDLKPLMEAFKTKKITYRLDQFIRLYNEDEFLDKVEGIMKFTPLPETNIRLFTDATPSIEELQIVLNNKDIIRIGAYDDEGKRYVLDPSVYHPKSKTYQILDGRASKNSLLKKEELYEYLEWIGDLMRGEYKDLTCLITVHMEAEQDALDWLCRNYPEIISRTQINHMVAGTNEWAHINVQFVLAAPINNYKMLREQVYRLKYIRNYFNRLEDRPQERNPFPSFLEDSAKSPKPLWKPIIRNHRDGTYKYPQFNRAVPRDSDERIIESRMTHMISQSHRTRNMKGKVTITYFLDNSDLDDVLIDEVKSKNEILGFIS